MSQIEPIARVNARDENPLYGTSVAIMYMFKVALNQLVEAIQLHVLLMLWCFYCSITLWLLQFMATLRDQLIAIYKVNQQYKYYFVKTTVSMLLPKMIED